ncbi:MAG: hypothetical protein E7Z75_10050 [Methanobrevibacter olleyae]|uniref:Uncharacterized protein n=1 Tax=Methanobrevibacter olleyae TaxID=294671 RepID=A0A8T3VQ63_METOL|nr:hypothetical protein [Methanobrevibacter olleyae]
MEIIKLNNTLKLSWKNKISLSETKPSKNNNLKNRYVSYRTVFPVSLYEYLNYRTEILFIYKINEHKYKISRNKNDDLFMEQLILKENNSNSSKKNRSGKRMVLKKSVYGEDLLKNSHYVEFSLIFNIENEKIYESCLMKFL